MSKTYGISVVIPVFKAEKNLSELLTKISIELEKTGADYEIILVDDGSPDRSWEEIQKCCALSKQSIGVKLSRNFGQHQAIFAGLSLSKANWVIVMDCDFQDDPRYIPELYKLGQKGNDIVFAKRINRTDKVVKKLSSLLFYKIFSYLTDSKFDGSIGNYGIYNKKVVDAILSMKEPFKVFSLMVRWVGFTSTFLEVEHGKRTDGKSTYTVRKLISLALTIVLTYSDKPMMLLVRAGIGISFLSLLFALYNVIAFLTGAIQVVGYASIITSIWLFGGIIIFTLGVLGLYLSKAFEGIKNRPVFIIDSIINSTP